MSSKLTIQPTIPSDKVELDTDPGRSFVIVRRNGDRYEVRVSAEDFARVTAASPWCVLVRKNSNCVYVQRKVTRDGKRVQEYLHHFVLGHSQQIDHRNGDGLDNRRSNLRVASVAQNAANRGPSRTSRSGIKGVFPCSWTGRWIAQITHERRQINLGRFDNIEDAAFAYRGAALLLHGSFARV